MKSTRILLSVLGLVSLILVGCQSNSLENKTAPKEFVSRAISMEDILRSKLATLEGDSLGTLYQDRKIVFHWVDTDSIKHEGKQLLTRLNRHAFYGLNQVPQLESMNQLVQHQELDSLVKLELLLSDGFVHFSKQLYFGDLDSINAIHQTTYRDSFPGLQSLLGYALNDTITYFKRLNPKAKLYSNLVIGLGDYLSKTTISDSCITVNAAKLDTANWEGKTKKALVIHGYIDSLTISKKDLRKAIKSFQKDHGLKADGVVGKYTAQALSKSTKFYWQKIVLNMNRLRKERKWAPTRVFVNVPEFKARLIQKDSTKRTHKIVVGNPKAPTFQMTDSISYLVAFPYWYIPKRIFLNEMLYKVRKDSTFMNKHEYELVKGGKVLDHDSIDWTKISRRNYPFKVRQKGGANNALGLVKFIFPNDFYIYMHDTPAKRFFNSEVRTFSHGCIRLQNPLSFAHDVLSIDSNTVQADSLDTLITNKERTVIPLNQKLPIYVRYFTCTADQNGGLTFFRDVYAWDEELLGSRKQKSVM